MAEQSASLGRRAPGRAPELVSGLLVGRQDHEPTLQHAMQEIVHPDAVRRGAQVQPHEGIGIEKVDEDRVELGEHILHPNLRLSNNWY